MALKSTIKNRTLFTGIILSLIYFYGIFSVYVAGTNKAFTEVAASQSMYELTIARSRGTIYDCNLQPITNSGSAILAVAMPTAQALNHLKSIAVKDFDIESVIKDGRPYIAEVTMQSEYEGIEFFNVAKRYGEDMPCANLIGYTDAQGNGICGIEQAFNEELSLGGGAVTMEYTCDAIGRVIAGRDKDFTNHYSDSKNGIALTIDKDLQEFCEESAKAITKGAIVVMSIPDGKIRAMVSCPDYNPNNLDDALNNADAPLINRATSAFAPGSVFKLVMTAAALEGGIDYKEKYNCTGSTTTNGLTFTCFGNQRHGSVNLHTALQKSCNCYFINLSKKLPVQNFTTMALNLGLGSKTELCPGFYSDSGNLTAQSLLNSNPRAISNFAIGQGDLTVTPVQMAGIVNAVASGGIYKTPSIYEGKVENGNEITQSAESSGGVPVMEELVALRLRSYMESAVKYGTAYKGDSPAYTAGAKTGTAETGVFVNDSQLLNYWYCGYMGPSGSPEYAVAILNEGAAEGDNPTGDIFKKIGEYIYSDASNSQHSP